MLVAGAVNRPPSAMPPDSPAEGDCYIVGADATGAWTGKSGCVAAWTSGGWRFVSPTEGMALFDRRSGSFAVYRAGSWEIGVVRGASLVIDGQQVVGPRAAAVAPPSGGAVIDAEARTAINAILGALQQHGLIAT